jgi:adenosylcobinamide kinase/adenosylcobinamide-phosphate guanylyltransferase
MTEPSRRVLVLGGARSGKSAHAESLLNDEVHVDYIANAAPDAVDTEWAERIARHRERRPASWNTLEAPDLVDVLSADGGAVLIDSITGWLAALIGSAGVSAAPDSTIASDRLTAEIDRTVGAWAASSRRVVAVSDEVGSGMVPAGVAERFFRDTLGLLNQRLAASSEEVWLVTAGIPLRLR